MFNLSTSKPTLNFSLGGNTNNNNTTTNNNSGNNNNVGSTSLFNKPFGNTTTTNNQGLLSNQSTTQQQALGTSSTTPQIDITHMRNTTKFDHLQQLIQQEITNLDNAIVNEQALCDQLANLIPSVKEAGSQMAPAIDYVSTKLEELEQGLENDAEAIVSFRDSYLKRDEAEVKCVFRNIDRLKVPRQYQVAGNTTESPAGGASILGISTMNSTGLTGWWNQPQTIRGMRSAAGIGGQSMQLVNEEADDGSSQGPKSMIDLFGSRVEQFRTVNEDQKRLLAEIEDFVEGLEEKLVTRERDINDRLNYGNANASERREEEKEKQMNQLRFVFGEVQRGLYEAADKVGTTRDGITELGIMR